MICEYSNVDICITVNKSDLSNEVYDYVIKNYSEVTDKIFLVSAKNGFGIDNLRNFLSNKSVAFAGQSAVGKTSLINSLFKTCFKTGDVSEKLQRGKHTTTSSKIIKQDGLIIYDTPGFSELYADVCCDDVASNFIPYNKYLSKCKYADCTHLNEPNCIIKQLVASGELSNDRYERYKLIYNEIVTESKNKYGK